MYAAKPLLLSSNKIAASNAPQNACRARTIRFGIMMYNSIKATKEVTTGTILNNVVRTPDTYTSAAAVSDIK